MLHALSNRWAVAFVVLGVIGYIGAAWQSSRLSNERTSPSECDRDCWFEFAKSHPDFSSLTKREFGERFNVEGEVILLQSVEAASRVVLICGQFVIDPGWRINVRMVNTDQGVAQIAYPAFSQYTDVPPAFWDVVSGKAGTGKALHTKAECDEFSGGATLR